MPGPQKCNSPLRGSPWSESIIAAAICATTSWDSSTTCSPTWAGPLPSVRPQVSPAGQYRSGVSAGPAQAALEGLSFTPNWDLGWDQDGSCQLECPSPPC